MQLRKYLSPGTYWLYAREKLKASLPRRLLPFSVIIDRRVRTVEFRELAALHNVAVRRLDIDGTRYFDWVSTYFPDWKKRLGNIHHKKFIELYTTYELLSADTVCSYMDVGGAGNTYIDQLTCEKRYVQDIEITDTLKGRLGRSIEYLESDARSINIRDESLDGISSHHAFEHFQEDSDTLFVGEVQRLLRVGGRCCIIPLFIG